MATNVTSVSTTIEAGSAAFVIVARPAGPVSELEGYNCAQENGLRVSTLEATVSAQDLELG